MRMEYITIAGRHVRLRPFLEQDLASVFEWRCDISNLHLWFPGPEVLSFQSFVDDFINFTRNFCHVLEMLCSKTDQSPIGMIYSYKPDYLNGHVFLCTFVDAQHRNYLYGAEASLLFVDYLFLYFPFRKIYAEVYEQNIDSIRNLTKSGWTQEGCLKKHVWRLGDYKDMHIFALYRETFYKRFSRMLIDIKKKTA